MKTPTEEREGEEIKDRQGQNANISKLDLQGLRLDSDQVK
jgi:hypothetical protein